MDFNIPEKTQQLLDDLDAFIEDVIKPIEQENDNIRFFDHRREDSRTDWDRDGLLDLICHWGPANTKCQPMFVRNIGTRTKPRFDHPRPLSLWGQPLYNLMKHGPYWAVHDIDGDGRPDLLAGYAYGNYAFYRRTAMHMPARPTFQIGTARMLDR